MLTQEEAEELGRKIDALRCTDPTAGDGLFAWVFKGEPEDQVRRFKTHLVECEFCRGALEIYRYKREIAKLLGHASE
jgi:hypothetical protein